MILLRTVKWISCICLMIMLLGSLLSCAADTSSSTISGSSPAASGEGIQETAADFNYRIHRYDEQIAWAVGANPKKPNQLQLLMTHDGGTGWRDITPSGDFPISSDNIASVDTMFSYMKPNRFWIIQLQAQSIAVFTTSDGGMNWSVGKAIPINGVITGFSFADEHEGWIYVNSKTGLGYSIDEIYHSSNSGLDWERISSVESGSIPAEGEKAAPSFINEQIGFIGVSMAATQPTLYRTDNGGRTWEVQKLQLSKPPEESTHLTVLSPSFLSDSQGVLPVYYDVPGEGKVRIMFYQTSDRGRTWTEGPHIEVSPDVFQFQFDFVSLSDGWLSTDQRTLYKSDLSWTNIFTAASEKIEQFDFINSTSGWAVFNKDHEHKLMETKDGGETWSKLPAHLPVK